MASYTLTEWCADPVEAQPRHFKGNEQLEGHLSHVSPTQSRVWPSAAHSVLLNTQSLSWRRWEVRSAVAQYDASWLRVWWCEVKIILEEFSFGCNHSSFWQICVSAALRLCCVSCSDLQRRLGTGETLRTVHPQLHRLLSVEELVRSLRRLRRLGAGARLTAALSELQQHRQRSWEAVTLHPTQSELS